MLTRCSSIVCVFVLVALNSCASLFRESPPSVEIVGPDDLTVQNSHGEAMRLYHNGPELYALPQSGHDDSIVISYHGRSHSIVLAKRAHWLTALDLFSYGPGFAIDDAGQTWYNYNPVYVYPDSTMSDFSVSSTDWFGEPSGYKRPELLLTGGWGLSLNIRPPMQDVAALLGPQYKFSFQFQGGIGLDLYKKYELFYLAQDEPGYALDPNAQLFLGQDADITSQSIAGRYFVHGNFFVQGSYGWAIASTDTLRLDAEGREVKDADGFTVFDVQYSNQFPVVGVAVGWAGDISFLSLHFSSGTQRFALYRFSDVLFRSIFLDVGLNLRF